MYPKQISCLAVNCENNNEGESSGSTKICKISNILEVLDVDHDKV